MRPRRAEDNPSDDLFRARLSNQLDLKHPLVQLAGLIEWASFDTEFGSLYHEALGRPGKPTRLMVGLSYLKHCYNLSDEQVCERWLENPYWQFFCGFDYLQHQLPIDPSSLTRWRERIGASGMERLLAATIDAALAAGAVKPSSLERVTIDTRCSRRQSRSRPTRVSTIAAARSWCGLPPGMASSCGRAITA
jgi:transposase, IS5 family